MLASRLMMRFELSLNAPTSLRLSRGAKPVRGLEKWRGEVEISHEIAKGSRSGDGFRLIGLRGNVRSDEPCVLARAGDSLTVWVVPDEVVGGVRVLYDMM